MTKPKKKPPNDVNVFVRMPRELREKLRALAVKLQASESEVMRCALRQFRGDA